MAVIDLKAPSVLQDHSIRNPVGLLISAIPKLFEGAGIVQLRAEWAAEKERAEAKRQLQELERQELYAWVRQQCSKWEGILSNPASTESDKKIAQRELAHFVPALESAGLGPNSENQESSRNRM